MKKLLLASTALLGLAGVAAAETGVTLSGTGRIGLVNANRGAGISDTQAVTRLRFNIDGKTETDSGAEFGGRIRVQHVTGSTEGTLSPALLYVSYEGLRVEFGNANTAFDSAALLYDSELGLTGSSFGDSRSSFYSFNSGPYGAGEDHRFGVFASYTWNGISGKISYVDPDQNTSTGGGNVETSIALSYEADQFAVSGAYAENGGGIRDNDIWFIGGAYKGLANTTIGLNYIDEGRDATGHGLDSTVVLYANYTMGATTLRGYIANNGDNANQTDTTYGIGADYDLGGATLSGGLHQDYNEDAYVDFGVNFSF